ncbi:hypothetical protein [Bacteroides sp.]|uniref:hypothetical protein n=1 Tax=Bacteroides sp. TaxID=29523 RepID=UPI003AB6B549
MKLVKTLLLVVSLGYILPMQAQKIEIIEPAVLECTYLKKMITDTLDHENDYRTADLKLRIGKQTSMFYAPKDLVWDSLSVDWGVKQQLIIETTEKSNGKESLWGHEAERIYKNYPAGKLRMYNHFSLMHWICTEDWENPEYDWATTTRKKYNETWFKYIHEDIGAKMSAAYSSYGLNVKIDKNRKLPHRNYELMEADYHK